MIGGGLALLLPWCCGTLWLYAGFLPQTSAGFRPMALGYGYLVGMLAATAVLRLMDGLAIPLNFAGSAMLLVVITGGIGGWRWRYGPWPRAAAATGQPDPFWQRALWVLLLVWLGVRLTNLLLEVIWLPLHPWDGWSTWMVRPQAWLEWKQLVPFQDAQSWLNDATGRVYHLEAWQYPLTVSLIALWPALALGQWHETMANLTWWGCGVALALGFYGQARLWGATALTALIFTWLLLSLPLLDAHLALAGYADLWLAAVFGLASISFMQWARFRDARQGLLALVLGLCCPTIKLEGAVWAALLLIAALAAGLPKRYLLGLAGVAAMGMVALFVAGGWTVTIPGLGDMQITADLIKIPGVGEFPLVYWSSGPAVIDSFFILDNWHLLFYLFLATLALMVWRIASRERPDLWATTLFIMLLLSAFFILFFFTVAGQWAQDFTSVNRIMLHFVPAILFWMLTVVVEPRPLVRSRYGVEKPLCADQR